MNKLLRHFLLLGAILGLFWQGVAYATPPCAKMQQEQNVAMAGMADCMDGAKQSNKHSVPCKDMTAGCMAMVGCASLVALDAFPVAVDFKNKTAMTAQWPTSPVMLGRNEAPIPDPPTLLG
jgi:hypothetical protein